MTLHHAHDKNWKKCQLKLQKTNALDYKISEIKSESHYEKQASILNIILKHIN